MKTISKSISQIQIEPQQNDYNKDKEISKLKRRINKLVINLSQKDQNILVLNDDVIYLEEQLNELIK